MPRDPKSAPPFKVSVLLPDLRGGGVERIRLELIRRFQSVGVRAELLLMRADGDLLTEVEEDLVVVDLMAERARQVAGSLIRYLQHSPPDALLVAMWPLTAIAPVAARLAGFRGAVVVSEHNILSLQYAQHSWLHRGLLRASTALGYRLATGRVAVSLGAAEDMVALSGVSPRSVTVIHNPIRRFKNPVAERALAEALWTGVGRRILTVGSLKNVKNHSLLIKAVSLLPQQSVQLMIVGAGQNEPHLRGLARELGLESQVIFAGFRAEPSAFYASADLFVLSSNNEGFGNVIVEALSFGLPVVSTDCPSGPAEILENGKYGRLVPVGDPEALAAAMAEALDAEHDRDMLRARGAEFSVERAADQYLALLDPGGKLLAASR